MPEGVARRLRLAQIFPIMRFLVGEGRVCRGCTGRHGVPRPPGGPCRAPMAPLDAERIAILETLLKDIKDDKS